MKNIFRHFSQSDGITLLSEHSYLNFTFAVLFSQLAFNMMNVALLFIVFTLTQSNFSVSMLIMTYLVPQVLLSFFGGIFADLQDKKSIMIWGNIIRGLALAVLYFNSNSLVIIYLVSFIVAVATQFYVPAEAPMIPYLVSENKYLIAANSIFGLGLFGTMLISYVLAGPLIDIVGKSITFLILSLLFFSAGLLASFIPKRVSRMAAEVQKPKDTERTVKKAIHLEFKESYFLLRKTADVGGAFFLLAFSQVIILILASVIPGYAEHTLKIPPTRLSLFLFAPAAFGMIFASFWANRLCKKFGRKHVMQSGVFMSGISLMLFPGTPVLRFLHISNATGAGILAFIAGFANALIFIPSQTIIQDMTPEDFRSKIYGLLFALIGIFSLVPILLAGSLADRIGVGSVLIGIGIFIIAIGLLRMKPKIKLA